MTALAERLRRRAILEADIWRLRRRHGGALRYVEDSSGGTALFVSLTEFVFQLKLEGLLGKALQLQGLRPVVLVPDNPTWVPRRYLAQFGIDSFVVLSDYLDSVAHEEAEEAARLILARDPSPVEIRELSFRGAQIGRNVLATISRVMHEGAVDLRDPRVRARLDEVLPKTLAATIAAERLLDELNPELVLFLERNYALEAPISDVALERGLNVVQYVSGLQDDSLVFKRFTRETRRLHPRSLSADSWERVLRMPWTRDRDRELDDDFDKRYGNVWALSKRTQSWTTDQPREDVMAALGLDPLKKTAVVYSHILWDANMFYGEDLFADQEEWFVETVRAAAANASVNWIVKLHPANVWKLKREGIEVARDEETTIHEKLGDVPGHVAIVRPESEISTRSIFRLTDYGITIRGSVGFELPCFGVPVLTAGTGFYSGRGFTVDSATPDEYLERLRTIETIPPLSAEQTELARRHAWALFRLRPTRFTSFLATIRPLDEMGHPLDHDLEIRLRTAADTRAADDLRRIGAWLTESRELDYLAGDE
ncbi:MAG: hypothetical protein QOG81_1103 [Gaiellaceae bacterium]|nr:hypothetical protein [Gaiellaceae bacterium]